MNVSELPTLDAQLFDWEEWNDEGPLSMQFSGVTLKVQVGEFAVGTKFPFAFILGERSLLVLIDEKQEEHGFKLNLSVGEKVDPSEGDHCHDGCCDHH
jgi:hypothetical protein